MPRHDYYCIDCVCRQLPDGAEEPSEDLVNRYTYEARYSINADEHEISENTICPFCSGKNVSRLICGPAHVRVRGGDWHEFYKNNKAAIQRDRNLHTLEHADPYADQRDGDDKAVTRDNLISERTKKPKRQYFT